MTQKTEFIVCCIIHERDLGHSLDSVLNAAACLIFLSRKSVQVTPLLRELQWLRFSERINYKLALLVFKCPNGLAPPYLVSCEFRRVADMESRAFPVAAALVWNSLPPSVTSSSSLTVFKSHLKSELLTQCY